MYYYIRASKQGIKGIEYLEAIDLLTRADKHFAGGFSTNHVNAVKVANEIHEWLSTPGQI